MSSVDVCVPWRDAGCEWRARSWDWVQRRYQKLHPEWGIVTADSDPGAAFNIGQALNRAVASSTADVVILAGADSVMASSALRIGAIHAETAPWVMLSDTYIRQKQVATEATYRLDPGTGDVPLVPGSRARTQLGWGMLAFRRSQFDHIGYDEHLTAAWEDSMIGAAAALMLGDPYRQTRTPTVLLWHPPAHRAHHPDFPNGELLYMKYRKAHIAGDRDAMRALLAEGRLTCPSTPA